MKIYQEDIVREDLVYKILKSLYGLKQAKRLWNKTITKFFQKIGFIPTNTYSCIFTIKRGRELIIIGMYVNNLALRSRNIKALKCLKDQLINKFSMKD